jgi:hypothetical protein
MFRGALCSGTLTIGRGILPGVLFLDGPNPYTVVALEMNGEGRISRIFLIAKPEKLGAVKEPRR